jgi:hypothetical protein
MRPINFWAEGLGTSTSSMDVDANHSFEGDTEGKLMILAHRAEEKNIFPTPKTCLLSG